MWATGELAKFKGNRKAEKELRQIALTDKFWAVRNAAVEAIGSWQDKNFINFLKEKAKDDNSQVRKTALRILGNFQKPELAPFFKERFNKEDSYLAQAEALKALGKTGDKNQIPFLKNAVALPSYQNIIKNSAKEALKRLEK